MTANLQTGKFNALNVTSSNLNNIKFDWQGNFTTLNNSFTMISKGGIKLDGDSTSRLRTSSGNLTVSTDTGIIKLFSGGTSSDAVYLKASDSSGGILMESGTNGIKATSSGDISIISAGSDINIGLPDDDFDTVNVNNLTRNIQMEATSAISMNSDDFQVLASDSISLISLSDDIIIGNSITTPAIKISGGDIAFGTASSTSDGKFVIGVSQSSSRKTGYDGIVLKSISDDVSPELLIKNNNGTGKLVIGVESATSTTAINERYLAYKSGTNIIRLNGPEFSSIDVGKSFYWTHDDISETITGTGTYITSASVISNSSIASTHTLTTTGTYTGTTTKQYQIEIDFVSATPNKFKWSNDGGKTYENSYVNITTEAIILENGITITFAETTGYSVGDYYTFSVGPTLTVENSTTYSVQEAYTLKPNIGYLMTETSNDLKLGTNNLEKMRISTSGNVGINVEQPLSTLHVSNKIGSQYLVNTTTIGNQMHPMVTSLTNGGYVVVWESINSDQTNYDIYGQIYYPNGDKDGNEFRINNTTNYNQAHPFVAANLNSTYGGFIVVWASEESDGSGIYDIRAQIFNETNIDGSRALKDFDIEVNQTSTYNQKYPSACSLSSGDYIIVWESDDADTGNSNIYSQKVTRIGNLSGSEVQVNTTSTYSQNYPVVAGLSANDDTVPGGYVVVFMSEYEDNGAYDIKYRIFNANMEAQNDNDVSITTGTTKSYGRCNIIGMDNGGFVVSYFKSYMANTSNYEIGEIVTSSDGTTAVIANISSSYPTKLHVSNISPGGLFHIGAEVSGSNSGNIEQVESVAGTSTIFTLSGGDIELTFSNSIISLVVHKYTTDSTTPVFTNSNVQTTELVDYNKQYNENPSAYTRNFTIFDYKHPRPSISELNDNNIIISWNTGNIPQIYYQKINSIDGTNIGTEQEVSPNDKGIVKYNPSISNVISYDKLDSGFVITWQTETFDHSSLGIYMMRLNDTNYLIRASNGASEWTITNDSSMGLGIAYPSTQLHMKGITPYITLQSTSQSKGDGNASSKIIMSDGSLNQLAEIKSCYHNYESSYPYAGNLQLWYKFDETSGMTTKDHSIRNNTGTLRNFDLKTDRVDGLIKSGLKFNGLNNYIDCGDSNSITGVAGGSFTISLWFKFPSTVSSRKYNLINNGIHGSGRYIIQINESNTLDGIITSSITSQVTGSTEVNDGEWHHVVLTHDSVEGYLYLYLDGNLEDSELTSAPFTSKNDENVYIGAEGSAYYRFAGVIDDVRIYNVYISGSIISEMYNNINKTIGRLILKTNSGDNLFYDDINSIIIDGNSDFRSLHVKGFPTQALSGTVYALGSSGFSGVGTYYKQELMIGDQVDVNGTRTTVTSISSNTLFAGSDEFTSTDTTPIRYPSIICAKDEFNTIKLLMDNEGNVGIGENNPETLVHLRGTTPYLTLENSTTETTNEGRESRINFQGINSSNIHIMGQIECSHDGTDADTKAKIKFSINDGSTVNEAITIDNNGHLFVGNSYSSSNAHIEARSNLNSNCHVMITNNIQNTTGINTRKSNLYFQNEEAGTGVSDLDQACYAKIMGSSDSDNTNIVGRLDFFTNNEDTMVPYISIKSNGKIGLGGINEPINNLHISVFYNSNGEASQSTTTITGFDANFTNVVIGSIIVFDDNSSAIITSVDSSSQLTVNTSQTVSQQGFKIYYPGVSVNSSAKMLVNTTTAHSSYLHIDGNLSTKVSTISSNTTLDATYSIILADTSSNNITITLPAVSGNTGLVYTIKKVSASNTLTIDGDSSETIDGSTTVAITTNYYSIKIVCDGNSWHIIETYSGTLCFNDMPTIIETYSGTL